MMRLAILQCLATAYLVVALAGAVFIWAQTPPGWIAVTVWATFGLAFLALAICERRRLEQTT